MPDGQLVKKNTRNGARTAAAMPPLKRRSFLSDSAARQGEGWARERGKGRGGSLDLRMFGRQWLRIDND